MLILFLARILSVVFHPLVLFLPLPYLIIMHAENNYTEAVRWTFFSWLVVFILGIFIMYQVKTGRFTNLDVSVRSQRPLFFLSVGIAIAVYIISLLLFNGPLVMLVLAVGAILALGLIDLLNTRIKASIHVASVTSILFAFVVLNGILYSWVLLLIPMVAWSRIKLHKHTVSETVTGAIFGFFITIIVYVMIELVLKG